MTNRRRLRRRAVLSLVLGVVLTVLAVWATAIMDVARSSHVVFVAIPKQAEPILAMGRGGFPYFPPVGDLGELIDESEAKRYDEVLVILASRWHHDLVFVSSTPEQLSVQDINSALACARTPDGAKSNLRAPYWFPVRNGVASDRSIMSQGWPMRSVLCESGKWQEPERGAIRVSTKAWPDGRLALTPIPLGFAANTAFYGALCFGLLTGVRAVIRRWRLRLCKCPRCGYSLKGLIGYVCPECGERW